MAIVAQVSFVYLYSKNTNNIISTVTQIHADLIPYVHIKNHQELEEAKSEK